MRVFVLGLDGASPELVFNWSKKGILPNMRSLIEQGFFSRLKTVPYAESAPAWNSIVTGVNPGKHAIYGFRDNKTFKIVTSRDRKVDAIWNILGREGMSSIVINVPVTYPPEKIRGIMISGTGVSIPSLNSEFVYPPDLKASLLRDGYEPEFLNFDELLPNDGENILKEFISIERHIFKTVVKLMAEREWDLFLVNFTILDGLQHFFWHYVDKMHPYRNMVNPKHGNIVLMAYAFMDKLIGELFSHLPRDSALLIISDHGIKTLHTYFYPNEWFNRLNLLRTKGSEKHGMEDLLFWKIYIQDFMGTWSISRSILGKVGKLRARLKKKRATLRSIDQVIDFDHTSAYYFNGGVFINTRNKEEYGKVKSWVKKMLESLRDKHGRAIVKRVLSREEVFWGDHARFAPDLTVVLNEGYSMHLALNGTGTLWSPSIGGFHVSTGIHEGQDNCDGIFLAYAEGMDKEKSRQVGNIPTLYDVVPTILKLLGIKTPRYMDGKPINLVGTLSQRAVQTTEFPLARETPEIYTPEEEEEIKKRLRSLGYL